MRKVSIKDIALKANVSNATVSLVLNGKGENGRVSQEKAKQIRQIAKDLNYHPNGLARSLQSGMSNTIGLVVADISNPFFGTLAFHVQSQMEQYGYTVVIMNTNESDLQMKRMLELLNNRQVDGYIIVPTEHGEPYVRQLTENGIPLVLVDRYFPSIQTYNLTVDGYQATYQATRLLIERGCERIAFLMYDNRQSHMNERKHGYADALAHAGLSDEGLVKCVAFDNLKEDVDNVIRTLLEFGSDGMLFATNTISLVALHALFKRKVKIPEDIQVVCFDRSEAFDFMAYPIPYIQQPIEVMARKAADLLVEQIKAKSGIPQVCKFPAKLVCDRK